MKLCPCFHTLSKQLNRCAAWIRRIHLPPWLFQSRTDRVWFQIQMAHPLPALKKKKKLLPPFRCAAVCRWFSSSSRKHVRHRWHFKRARASVTPLVFRMTTESMPAATPSALVGDIACAAVLKCPSPVTLAAAHIARQMGVLTDFSVPGAAGDEPPSLRVGNATGSILVFELEKENVCPVTGVYARLASGEGASGPGDTGTTRAAQRPVRILHATPFLPRALRFEKYFQLTRSHVPSFQQPLRSMSRSREPTRQVNPSPVALPSPMSP